jgi:hypothetical protein
LPIGDADQVLASYRVSIDAVPYLPYPYLAHEGPGGALVMLSWDQDAIEAFRKAVAKDARHAGDARFWLAAGLEPSGGHVAATATLRDFLDGHPGLEFSDASPRPIATRPRRSPWAGAHGLGRRGPQGALMNLAAPEG